MYDYEPCAVGWVEGRQPADEAAGRPQRRAVWEIAQRQGIEDGAGARPSHHASRSSSSAVRSTGTRGPASCIYEPFWGSGTALIAAEMSGRRCYALELARPFIDVACHTWDNYTGPPGDPGGRRAQLAEVAAERSPSQA